MDTIKAQDVAPSEADDSEQDHFGKAPQPWQLRNSWAKPKRKRKRSAKTEIDLWAEEL